MDFTNILVLYGWKSLPFSLWLSRVLNEKARRLLYDQKQKYFGAWKRWYKVKDSTNRAVKLARASFEENRTQRAKARFLNAAKMRAAKEKGKKCSTIESAKDSEQRRRIDA